MQDHSAADSSASERSGSSGAGTPSAQKRPKSEASKTAAKATKDEVDAFRTGMSDGDEASDDSSAAAVLAPKSVKKAEDGEICTCSSCGKTSLEASAACVRVVIKEKQHMCGRVLFCAHRRSEYVIRAVR